MNQISTAHRFPYEWTLKDAVFTKDKGKVFSCFSCGGGSTMGYKLAGFDVIGCNEIDPKMMECYIENHNPKYPFLAPIQTFKDRQDLPKELFELDILDGSPPCSSFSMAGNRESDWGKDKKFREGQSKQVLDTLFFDFIDLAKRLQPKIVIAENVKGLLLGEAKKYVIKINDEFDKAGYKVQHFLLDASKMGVPQRRERVFFIALRKDLCKQFDYHKDMFTIIPKIKLSFNEPDISYKNLADGLGRPLTEKAYSIWEIRDKKDRKFSETLLRNNLKENNFGTTYVYENEVVSTLDTKGIHGQVLFNEPKYISDTEIIKISTFPQDYKFNINVGYICGMSVPPIMMANIATEIYNQWLKHIK